MKKTFCLIFLIFCGTTGFTQIPVSNQTREALQNLPQEEIFVHLSSSIGLPGETLYYRLYTLNSETKECSKISQIAYLALIDKNEEAVFSHKLTLENGLGAGDFFIPSDIATGNYKLIAYTQWMNNAGENHFFQTDFSIINPYRDLPAQTNISEKIKEEHSSTQQDKQLTLEFEKTAFSTREKAIIRISNPEALKGEFSISVRKKDKLTSNQIANAIDYEELYSENHSKNHPNTLFLPELRGHLISGSISAKGTSAANQNVALSIPGSQPVFKIASTNKNGRFFFNLDKSYSAPDAFLQILNSKEKKYEISLVQIPMPEISKLDFPDLSWNPENLEALEQRSIHNQIENAYFEVRLDSLEPPKPSDAIFEEMTAEVFNLDDYTRFDSVEETFIEIINSARIRTNAKGDRVLLIYNRENGTDYNLPPLLVIDGIIEQNHQEFINFPSRDIQKIEIFRDNLFLGPHVAQGIIKVTTKDGRYHNNLSSEISKTEIAHIEPKKNYVFPDYPLNTQARIPDYRHQLYWKPDLKIEGNHKNIEFYTSDVTGEFEINIQGFTENGRPVSIIQTFEVE